MEDGRTDWLTEQKGKNKLHARDNKQSQQGRQRKHTDDNSHITIEIPR